MAQGLAMAQGFMLWLGQFVSRIRPISWLPSQDRRPTKIEVEPLPDYRWRELGFARRRTHGEQ